LVGPGIERPLNIYAEEDDWTTSQKSLHGLAALDFSAEPGTHIATQESRKESTRASEATGENRSFNFLKKIL
jgi:hypothetical protein